VIIMSFHPPCGVRTYQTKQLLFVYIVTGTATVDPRISNIRILSDAMFCVCLFGSLQPSVADVEQSAILQAHVVDPQSNPRIQRIIGSGDIPDRLDEP
jgi:hypothetical protein